MKNRDEYIESIFEKRDRYVANQRRMRRTVLSVCIPLTVCLAAAVIVVNSPIKSFSKSSNCDAASSLGTNIESVAGEAGTEVADEMMMVAAGYDEFSEESVQDIETVKETEQPASSPKVAAVQGSEADTVASVEATQRSVTSVESTTRSFEITTTKSSTTDFGASPSTTTPEMTDKLTQSVKKPTITSAKISSTGGYSMECGDDSAITLSDINKVLSWTYDNDFSSFDDSAAVPDGEIFTFQLGFSDGSTAKICWSENNIRKNDGRWKTVPDSYNETIDNLVD